MTRFVSRFESSAPSAASTHYTRKVNRMHKISKYFRGVGEEARRIRWPDRKLLWQSVAKVLVIALVAALVIALSDYLIIQIIQAVEEAYPQGSDTSADSSSTAAAAEAIRHGIRYVKNVLGGSL